MERDYDDGCLELTILHENLRKEVLSTVATTGSRTEWELHRLPQNIWMRCSRLAYTLDDDEFECIETSGGCGMSSKHEKTVEYDLCGYERKYRGLRRLMDRLDNFEFLYANIHLIKSMYYEKMILAVALLLFYRHRVGPGRRTRETDYDRQPS